MKQTLFLLLAILPFQLLAQCSECHSFEAALKNPEKVKSIIINSHVHKIMVDSIPAYMDRFVNLEFLYLTDQPIDHITGVIGKLPKLKELSLAGCRLTKVPDFIFAMKNLQELILFSNPFSEGYNAELKKKAKLLLPNTKVLLD